MLEQFKDRVSVMKSWFGALIFPSPAKILILRVVKQHFREINAVSVLDAACADFKYRFLFPHSIYKGVDFEADAIKRGIERCSKLTEKWASTGVVADIREPMNFAGGFDLVVSLHTIDHIDLEQKTLAVSNLAKMVGHGGSLVVHGQDIEHVIKEFTHLFEKSRVIKCDSNLSQKIEGYWGSRSGRTTILWLTLQLFCFSISYVLSFIEPKISSSNNSKIYLLSERSDTDL